MLSRKFLLTLFAIVLAIFAMCRFDFNNQPLVENWMGMGSQTVTAVPELQGPGGVKTAFSGNYFDKTSLMGSGKFVSVPSFQSMISPRFSNVQYGANIRYNMPDRQNLATPCDPLTFGDMAKENYSNQLKPQQAKPQQVKENYGCGTGQCGDQDGLSCGKGGYGLGRKIGGGYELPAGYTNGNYMDVYNSLPSDSAWRSQPCGDAINNALPIGTMATVNADGNPEQFVVMNRLMNTNMKSRKRGLGDPIRGDLAITPCQSGWFSVYPTINVDLNPGAMGVLGGFQTGETNSKLMELLINSSGGGRTTFGGVDYSDAPPVNMTPSYNAAVSSASTDVGVTSFP